MVKPRMDGTVEQIQAFRIIALRESITTLITTDLYKMDISETADIKYLLRQSLQIDNRRNKAQELREAIT